MTNRERTSGERGISLKTWIIIFLLLTSSALGYDKLFNNNSANNTNSDEDRTSITSESDESEAENLDGSHIRIEENEVTGIALILQSLGLNDINDIFLPENLDVHWTESATTGIPVRNPQDYLNVYTLLAEMYENNADFLLDRSPDALRFFGDLHLAGLTDWADTLTPAEVLSQGFSDVLNTEEGQQAFLESNELFQNSLVTRTINGRPQLVFAEHPGSNEAEYENLWISSPNEDAIYSELIVDGFDTAQKALFSQVAGYIRLYSQVHSVQWSESQIENATNRIVATYLDVGFRPDGGYTQTFYLGNNNYASGLSFYLLSPNIQTRMLIAQPNEDRTDNGQWQCASIVSIPEGESANFGVFDYENATYTSSGSAVHPRNIERMTSISDLTNYILNNENAVLNLRIRHTADSEAVVNVPVSYENDTPDADDNSTTVLYEPCTPVIVTPVETEVPVIVPNNPQSTPVPPRETPRPPEDDDKSPNEDTDGDGAYRGDITDRPGPIDEDIDQPQPLPTAPGAGETPPSF